MENNMNAAVISWNGEELARLSRLLIGSRSIRDFAKISDLSVGFLSRITNNSLKSAPTRRSLEKLAEEKNEPQNGITFHDLMKAAGYAVPSKMEETVSHSIYKLPYEVTTVAYPVYLLTGKLERPSQLGNSYLTNCHKEWFAISSIGFKEIIGIPAFCALDAVDNEMVKVRFRLVQVYESVSGDVKDKFIVVITNQQRFYDEFDKVKVLGVGSEIFITLTRDFKVFDMQRPIKTVNAYTDREEVWNSDTTYQLTEA